MAYAFLKDGTYKVRGSVRDTKNEAKIEPLRKAFGELFDQMTLVEADCEKKETMMKAAEGVDFIVHTASPFPIKKVKHEDELINPAVKGTTAIMEAALENKIKRVVITSSIAAIMSSKPADKPADRNFTEKHWSDPSPGDHIDPYSKSKTMAEQAAWAFKEKNKETHDIEIVTINPSLIMGPAFVGAGFSSGEIITNIILGKFPGLPKVQFGLVDVRDCAQAHLQALKVPEAANKRFILCRESMWFTQIGVILNKKWSNQGYTPVTRELPKFLCQIGSYFMSELNHAVKNWGIESTFDRTQSHEILKIEYSIPMEDTLNEMAQSMIETGALLDKRPKAATAKM